jgi:lipopolysaccharide export system protein LptC
MAELASNRGSSGEAIRSSEAPTTSRAGLDYTPLPRIGAFRAAGRHTARVRFLRRTIVLASVVGVSIIAIAIAFDPLKHLPKGVSIGGVGIEGTKITMDSPRISGVQQGGGAYDVAAKTGIQDTLKPNVIELLNVDAHVGMSDATTTHVLAKRGVYDNHADTMDLHGNVRIANTSGYTFILQNATIDFKQGTMTSQERSHVDMKGGYVVADTMTIDNHAHMISFGGHIVSMFQAADEDRDTPSDGRIEGSAP